MSPLQERPLRGLKPGIPLAFIVSSLLIGVAGCSGSMQVLSPASPEADQISGLFWGVFSIAVVIFLLVEVLLVAALIRFRNRPGAEEPKQTHGNTRLEIGWTVAPMIIVMGIFVATVGTMFSVTRQQTDALRLKVVGHQWWWEVQYPDLGITSATDVYVPVGQSVEIELTTGDVIHSFWVPELAGKMDVIPGQPNRLGFTPRRAGTYRGVCAEFCGDQHANMGFLVVAVPQEQFDEWVERMRQPAVYPGDERGEEGLEAFLSSPCIGCHTVQGTRARGRIGPDLTHFGSRSTIAAMTVDNTRENLTEWLRNPQRVKPGNKMPTPNLDQEKIEETVYFLESLK